MPANNIPNNLPSVERLVQRIVAAERAQQREIRLTVQEARELTAELAIITSKLGKTVAEIHDMLSELKSSDSPKKDSSGFLDGGGF